MSQNVDNRIVKMEFDNTKFESNVKTSLSTIDKLKAALDFDKQTESLEALQREANKITLDDLSASLDKLNNRFSAFGVAGMTVIQDLTRSAEQLASKLLSVFTTPYEQAKNGGWSRAMNIKDAEFSMKGLGILGEKLESIKDDINYAVSGTAYGYDSAARAAAQFAASNVQIGDQMKTSLRAVSGVAAQTNSSYEDIASIFTTVAGNGKLMTQQLRQLSFRGLNAAAVLASAMGVTESEINDMVTKGKISFDQFAEAMDNAFGEHATAANETFTGALNNMKAALSRIGANFADPLIDAERDVFNKIRDILNSFNSASLTEAGQNIKDQIDSILQTADPGNVTKVRELNRQLAEQSTFVTELGKAYTRERDSLLALENPTEDQKKRIKELNKLIEEQTIVGSGAFTRLANVFKANLENFRNSIVGLLQLPQLQSAGNNLIDAISEIAAAFSEIAQPIARAWRSIFPDNIVDIVYNLTLRFKKFTQSLRMSKELSSDLESAFRGLFSVMSILGKVAGILFDGLTTVGAPAFRTLIKLAGFLGERIVDLEYYFDVLCAVLQFVWSYFTGIIGPIASIKDLLNGLSIIVSAIGPLFAYGLVSGISLAITALENLASAVVSVLDQFGIIDNVLIPLRDRFSEIGTNILQGLVTGIQNGVSAVGRVIVALAKFIVEAFKNVLGIHSPSTVFIALGKNVVAGLVKGIVDAGKTVGSAIVPLIQNVIQLVSNTISSIAPTLSSVLGNVIALPFVAIATALQGVINIFQFFGDAIRNANLPELLADICEKLEKLKDMAVDFFEVITNSELWQSIKAGIKSVTAELAGFFEQMTASRFAAIMFAAAMAVVGITIVRLASAITNLIQSGAGVLTSVSGVLDSIKKFTDAITQRVAPVKKASTQFKEIAEGIVLIAGSILLISQIENPWPAFGVLAATMAMVTAFMVLMSKLQTVMDAVHLEGMAKTTASIIAFSVSLVAVSLAIAMIGQLPVGDELVPTLQRVCILLSTLAVVAAIATITARAVTSGGGSILTILAYSGSLYLLALTFKKISDAKINKKDTLGAFEALLPIIAAVGLCALAMGRITIPNALGLLVTIGALYAAVPLFNGLLNVDFNRIIEMFEHYKVCIGVLTAVALAVGWLINKMDLASSFRDFGLGMAALSASLLLMASAVNALGQIDGSKLAAGVISMSIFMILITIMAAISNKTKGNSMLSFGVGLLAVMVSLTMMIGIAALAGELDKEKLARGVLAVAVLSVFVLAMQAISGIAGSSSPHAWKAILAQTLQLVTVAIVIYALSQIPWTSMIAPVAAIGTVFLALGASIKMIESGGAGSSAGRILIGMLGTLGILITVAVALTVLSQMPWQGLIASMVAIGGVMLAVGYVADKVMEASSKASAKSFLGMLEIIGLLAVIGATLYVVSQNNWASILAAAGGIDAVLFAIQEWGGKILNIGKGKQWKNIGKAAVNIGILAGLIFAIGATLKLASDNDWASIVAASAGISAVLFVLSEYGTALMSLGSKLSSWGDIAQQAAIIGEFCVLIGVIGATLALVAQNDWTGIAAAGVSISGVLFTLGTFATALTGLAEILTSADIVQVGELILGMIFLLMGIGGAIALVASFDWQNALAAGASITAVLLALGAMTPAFIAAGSAGGYVVAGAALIAAAFDAMVLIIGAMGAFVDALPDGLVESAKNGLADIAEMLGGAYGAFVSAIGDAVFDSLPGWGEDIQLFLENIAEGINSFSAIDQGALDAIPAVATALLALTAAELIEGLGNLVDWAIGGDSMDSIKENLADFADCLVDFAETVNQVTDWNGAVAASEAGKQIFDMLSQIPNTGGLLGAIVGDNDLTDQLIEGLPKLGDALVAFDTSTQDLSNEGVAKASIAMDMINAFSKNIPNSGGLAGWLAGNNDVDDFGTKLPKLGTGLNSFSKKVKDLDTSSVTKASNAMSMLVELANEIPNDGGFIAWLVGDNDIGDFSEKLPQVGEGLAGFSDAIQSGSSSFSYSKVEAACDALYAVIDVAEAVTGTASGGGGLSTTGLENWVKKLPGIGEGLADFADNVGDTDELQYTVDGFKKCIEALMNLDASVGSANQNGIQDVIDALNQLDLSKMRDAAKQNIDAFIGTLQNGIQSISNAETALVNRFGNIGSQIQNAIRQHIVSKQPLMRDAAVQLMNAFLEGLNQRIGEPADIIGNMMSNLINKLREGIDNFRQTGVDMIASFNDGLGGGGAAESVYQTGRHIANRFADGIGNSESVSRVRDAARNIARTALQTIDNVIQDPVGVSDAAFYYGRAVSRGFAMGINNNVRMAYRAADRLGVGAINALDNAIDDPVGISTLALNLGQSVSNGFAQGMLALRNAVSRASNVLGQLGLSGLAESARAAIMGRIQGNDLIGGLITGVQEAINSVNRHDTVQSLENLFNEIIPTDVAANAGAASGAAMGNALANAALTNSNPDRTTGGSGGSGGGRQGSGSASNASNAARQQDQNQSTLEHQEKKDKEQGYKWTTKDVTETLGYLSKIYQQYNIKFSKFNKGLLENGKATLRYLASSVKNTLLRNGIMQLGQNEQNRVRDLANEEYKRLLKKYNKTHKKKADKDVKNRLRQTATRNVAKAVIKEYEAEYKDLKVTLTKMIGQGSTRTLLEIPTTISTWIKYYDKNFSSMKGAIKKLSQTVGKKSTTYMKNLGEYLFKQSDEYKNATANLKTYSKQIDKLQKKAKAQQNIINDPSASAKRKQQAKARLKELASQMAEVQKNLNATTKVLAQGPEKALKSLRKEIKNTVKEFLSLSNLDWGHVMSGFDKFTQSTATATANLTESFDAFAEKAESATENLTDAFDLLSASYTTSIDLLTRYTKTGTAEVEALMEYATGQLEAYEEFQNGIKKMETMGFSSALVDELYEKGPDALNYIRGFLNMTDAEVAEYNNKISKREEYEADALTRSMNKKVEEYSTWMANIEKLAANGLSDGIKKKLIEAGVGQAAFVSALTRMDGATLSNISELYEQSLDASGLTEKIANVISNGTTDGTIDYLKVLRENGASYDKWKSDIKAFSKQWGGLISNSLVEAIESAGYQDRGLLDWLMNANYEQIREYASLYKKYVPDEEDPYNMQAMVSGVKDQIKSLDKWYTWLKKMKASGYYRTYEEISEMGFETGYAYAQAWAEGDAESRKSLEHSLKVRDRTDLQNVFNQLLDKKRKIIDWSNQLNKLSKYLPKAIWQELYEMGPEGADAVSAVYDAYQRMMKGDVGDWNKFIDIYSQTVSTSGSAADTIVAGYAQSLNEASNATIKEFKVVLKETLNKAGTEMTSQLSSKNFKKTWTTSLKNTGKKMTENISSGISEKASKERVFDSGTTLVKTIKSSITSEANINTAKSGGKKVGKGIDDGMVDGIESGRSSVITAAVNTAVAAYQAACAALGVNSPSKVFYEIGRYVDEGFANGITAYSNYVTDAVTNTMSSPLDELRETLNNLSNETDISNPVIKPTLDLSDVTAEARRINSMFDDATIGAKLNGSGTDSEDKVVNMTFNQNNYSPKELSRLDIYRQTKNQFAMAKGIVKAL